MGVGDLAVISTLAIAFQTYHIQKNKIIIRARPESIALILAGLLLVAGGYMVYPTNTSLETCVAKQWLVIFGFYIELTPLTVKVYAINTLIQQEKKMR